MIVDLLYTGFVFTRLRPPVYDSWQTLDNWNISENQFFLTVPISEIPTFQKFAINM